MKLSPKQILVLKHYLTGLVVAIAPVALTGDKNLWSYVLAAFAGVIVPAFRAWDKNDTAYGRIAEQAINQVGSVLEAKATKAPTTK